MSGPLSSSAQRVQDALAAAGLASRIVELFDEDDCRQEIAANGRRFVQRFTWDVAAEHLERFLVDHLVGDAPTGRALQ